MESVQKIPAFKAGNNDSKTCEKAFKFGIFLHVLYAFRVEKIYKKWYNISSLKQGEHVHDRA